MTTKQKEELFYTVFKTKLGWVGLIKNRKGLLRSTLPTKDRQSVIYQLEPLLNRATNKASAFKELTAKINGYFEKGGVDLAEEPIDLNGAAPFFKRAWTACRSITPGEVRSYSWLAAESGNLQASRAAGQAMARNPLPLFVPCHRVINAQGKLHNFGGAGIPLKRRLLEIEGYKAN